MGAIIEEHLMADGRWSVGCDYDQVTDAEFVGTDGKLKTLHALIEQYDPVNGWGLIYTGVVKKKISDRDGINISGPGASWWLGSGSVGPLIVDREFVSGNNKLSNGSFEYDAFGDQFHFWTAPQTSKWITAVGSAHTGAGAAYVNGDNLVDDILVSNESFPAAAGQQYRTTLYVKRGPGTVGRIRCRAVYEGRFNPLTLLSDGNFEAGGPGAIWTDSSTVAGDAAIISGAGAHSGNYHLRLKSSLYHPNSNGSFETGTLANWTATVGTWSATTAEAFNGSYSATCPGDATVYKFLTMAPGGSGVFPVVQGEKWRIQGACKSGAGADGRMALVLQFYTAGTPVSRLAAGDMGADTGWRVQALDFDIPAGIDGVVPFWQSYTHSAGSWYVDATELLRLKGNRAAFGHTGWFITPGRTYTLTAFIRSDSASMEGDVWPLFRFDSGAGSLPTIIEGTRQGVSAEWVQYTTTVTPPSGSAIMSVAFMGQDMTLFASFHVDDITFIDNDKTTIVYDNIGPAYVGTWLGIGMDTTAPPGTARIHHEIVAEAFSNGWLVDDAVVSRIGVTPSTHAAVTAALLLDPDTGAPLSLAAGTITGSSVIPFDWAVHNLRCRDALDHFCRVVASPRLEWRVRPDPSLVAAGLIDVGASLFFDHSPTSSSPIVLTANDLDVQVLPAVEQNTEDRVSKVKVIGADRISGTGDSTLITATVSTGVVDTDWAGRPINRTLLIEDSTVDHVSHATALATYHAQRNANPQQTLTAVLTGSLTRPAFDVGDWVYAYHPEAGLTDPAYPTVVEGVTVYPARKRVLSRVTKLGSGYRVRIRRQDGTTFLLPGSNYESENAASLELGDYRPDFVTDPTGGTSEDQFTRFRASAPR